MLSKNMIEFLQENQVLLNINPTQFLIEFEEFSSNNYGSTTAIKDMISFMNIFDTANIIFDINQLFNSEAFGEFKIKYLKKDATEKDIDMLLIKHILNNFKGLPEIIEIPEDNFKDLSNSQIERAIRHAYVFVIQSSINGRVKNISLDLLFDKYNYTLELYVKVIDDKIKYFKYNEPLGIWLSGYGFAIKEDFYDMIDEVNKDLIKNFQLVKGDED